MKLSSSAFKNNQEIPMRFTGDDKNLSPPLEWTDVPHQCKSLALICVDLDAHTKKNGHSEPFTHWVIYDIPPSLEALPEGISQENDLRMPLYAKQGKNSFDEIGYGGPFPPVGSGVHHYVFTLYALDRELRLPAGSDREALWLAMQGHIVAVSDLTGIYDRQAGNLKRQISSDHHDLRSR